MKRILTLYKMINKNNTFANEDGKSSSVPIYAVMGIIAAVLLGLAGYRFADMLEYAGGIFSILALTGLSAGVAIFLLGLFMLINSMYMSSDIEILITLPLSSFEIAFLRILSFLKLAYALSIVLIGSVSIGYMVAKPSGTLVWLGVVLAIIIVPLFATAITSTFVMLIMSVVRILRNMDVLRYIGIVFLFLMLCLYFYLTGGRSDSIDTESMISQISTIGMKYKYMVPASGFIVDFIYNKTISSLLLALAITIASIILNYFVGKALYLDGALNMQSTLKTGKILSDEKLSKVCTKKTPLKSLRLKEFWMLWRNPVYSLNNFFIGFLWPILAVVLFKGMGSLLRAAIAVRDQAGTEYNMDIKLVLSETAIMIFLIMIIPMTYANVAYSSLSREGQSFPVMKQIPVSFKTQIRAKIGVAERIHQISTTVYVAIVSIILNIMMGIPFYFFIVPSVISFLIVEISIYMDMLLGFKQANVSWDNEKTATRKNSAVLLLYDIVMALLIPAILVVIIILVPIESSVIVQLLPVVFIAILLFAVMLLLRKLVIKRGIKKIRTLRF